MAKSKSIQEKTRKYIEDLFTDNKEFSSKLPSKAVNQDGEFDAVSLIEAENTFDLTALIKKAVDPITGVPRDMKLPEGDFKEARNYFHFCSKFLGNDSKFPFARQMWLNSMLFGEICPRCSDKRFLKLTKVPIDFKAKNLPDRLQFMHYGVCPECGATKAELIKSREINHYVEMALCVGQRAGKSTMTASAVAYIIHKYLKFPKLSSLAEGIQTSTPLTGTFIGLRTSDAISLLWEPITNNIKESPWFQSYHGMLDDYGKRYGVEFYRHKDLYLRYAHRNLEFYPAGPMKRGLRGRTRLVTATDEIGWFPVTEDNQDRERGDGPEVYKALDRSLLTVRTEVRTLLKKGYNNFLTGLAVNISSPSSQGDMITRLVEENKDSRTCLAVRLPTWEISPLYTRETDEIANAYRIDAVAADRDYGANPPLTSSQFIDPMDAVQVFTGLNRATISHVEKSINGKMRMAAKIETMAPLSKQPASLMSLDAGLTNNSFAVTILHLDQSSLNNVVTTKVIVPVALEIQPKKGYALHYPMIYKHVLHPLIKAFNVRFLFADRWNSISTLDKAAEDFTSLQLVGEQYSVKYHDFALLRSYIEDRRIVLPKIEMDFDKLRQVDSYPSYFLAKPAAHLLFQLATVKDRQTQVVKGDGFTDDIFRALVLGIGRILHDKIMPEILKFTNMTAAPPNVGAITAGRMLGMSGMHSMMGARPMHTAVLGHTGGNQTAAQPQGVSQAVVRVSR